MSVRKASAGSRALARPKSSTFTVPSGRSLMFAGLRSRWMIPCSCAASRASAICRAIGSASASGIGPRAMRSASVAPVDQLQDEAVPPPPPRGHRSRRCSGGSATRALGPRAGSAPAGRDPARRRGQDLQRDFAVQPAIGPVHLAHPARAQHRQDLVHPEASAGCERHGLGGLDYRRAKVGRRLSRSARADDHVKPLVMKVLGLKTVLSGREAPRLSSPAGSRRCQALQQETQESQERGTRRGRDAARQKLSQNVQFLGRKSFFRGRVAPVSSLMFKDLSEVFLKEFLLNSCYSCERIWR